LGFFWIVLYNALFVPAGFIAVYLAAIFNKKMHTGLKGRNSTWKELKKFRENYSNKPLYLIHSASLGEYEQAKPVIRGLKTVRPDTAIAASFTSPSGYTNARRIPEVDIFLYLPLDTFFRTRRFIQRLKPQKIIFIMYELWPNLIVNAKRHRVPTYLISARLHKRSLKSKPVVRSFFRSLYRSLDYIYAVSEEDKKLIQQLIGSVKIRVLTLGDTRYDQVIQRAQEKMTYTVPKLFKDGFIFIAGSIWPQDVRYLLPPLYRIMDEHENFKLILAPHEPNEYALEMLEDNFQQKGYSTLRLSNFQNLTHSNRVILVDSVGILPELYYQADLAFVGGSFRGSIHNVMEPAIAGLPVLFGPMYHNSREAELLIRERGALCCENEREIYEGIKKLIDRQEIYRKMSNASRQIIIKNLGASANVVKEILETN
jgi:3-deoxy-D-manno-octulosonic-acid transferase